MRSTYSDIVNELGEQSQYGTAVRGLNRLSKR